MAKGSLQIDYEKLVMTNLDLLERTKELEQTERLLKIQRAEALEACIGEDIIKATEILEQALKGE